MSSLSSHQLHPLHPQTSLHWRRCADTPQLLGYPVSVLIGDVVYVAGYDSRDMLRYDTRSDKWSVLPPCPVKYFVIRQLSGKLVTVGGSDGSDDVGDVYAYEEETQQWEKSIPPMPTPRIYPTVVTYRSSIAVCGGYGGDQYSNMDIVEVFNSDTSVWFTAAPLPVACEGMYVTVINDTCYLGGGGGGEGNRSIMCASLPSLFQSTTPHNQVWTKLPDLPHGGSALTNMGGTLLALGGSAVSLSEDIHAYCPNTKAWVKIGSLPQACGAATAELLPSGEVMLMDSRKNWSKSVYMGTLQLKQS